MNQYTDWISLPVLAAGAAGAATIAVAPVTLAAAPAIALNGLSAYSGTRQIQEGNFWWGSATIAVSALASLPYIVIPYVAAGTKWYYAAGKSIHRFRLF